MRTIRWIALGFAALGVTACAGAPNHAARTARPETVPQRPAAAPYTRARRVAPEEENPPIARAAERSPLPAPGDSAANGEGVDPQTERERHNDERERQIKQRMNSICSGC